jgi:hypothetical protein
MNVLQELRIDIGANNLIGDNYHWTLVLITTIIDWSDHLPVLILYAFFIQRPSMNWEMAEKPATIAEKRL